MLKHINRIKAAADKKVEDGKSPSEILSSSPAKASAVALPQAQLSKKRFERATVDFDAYIDKIVKGRKSSANRASGLGTDAPFNRTSFLVRP